MMVAQSASLSRKLLSDKRPTWPTSPTDSPSTTSTVRHTCSHGGTHFPLFYLPLFLHCGSHLSTEALNQGENVDLDALMADLSSIEQELSTINSKPGGGGGSLARLGLTDTKVRSAEHWKSLEEDHEASKEF